MMAMAVSSSQFKQTVSDVASRDEHNALSLPTDFWACKELDQLDLAQVNAFFLPMLRFQMGRAMRVMPEIYGKAYSKKKISPKGIKTIEDFWQLPILVKDSTVSGVGFRSKVALNPEVMRPNDLKEGVCVYKSGGTKGVPTPTFITPTDRDIEAYALGRCFSYMGMGPRTRMLNTYNPTHKGGDWIKEAVLKLGGTIIPRRTTDTIEQTMAAIESYDVNTVATVQGPISLENATRKGGGVDFLGMVEAGQQILEERVDTLFITGYTLIDELVNWAENFDKKLATTLGSSEAIPQATSTTIASGKCKYNQQHVINGPHYVEVLKEESGVMVPVKEGEEGILAYTTVARSGTIYLRYAPGDVCTLVKKSCAFPCGLKSDIITDIGRKDVPEDVVTTGCCIG